MIKLKFKSAVLRVYSFFLHTVNLLAAEKNQAKEFAEIETADACDGR